MDAMQTLHDARRTNIVIAIGVALIIVVVGFAVVVSRASSPYVSTEVEAGQTGGNGPVTTGTDATASAGKYVQFTPKQ